VTSRAHPGELAETKEESTVPNQPAAAPRNPFADIAPALAEYTDNVLFGDVWKRPGLSPRDRSLVTVASLVALYRINELPFHLKRALENGVSRAELVEMITHLAFYAGWPTAASALPIAKRVFEEAGV
jgi:4-carboxymuconolactone decarboxylase